MIKNLVRAILLGWCGLTGAAPLDDVKGRLADAPVLRGQFEQQKTVAGFKKPLLSSGDFLLWRDHGVLWQTRKPFASTLSITRNGLSAQSGNTGYRLSSSQEPAMRAVNEMLLALLGGDLVVLQRQFKVTAQLTERGWSLQLTPLDAALGQVLRQVELSGDRYVRQVLLEESSGDHSRIRFEQLAEQPAPTAEERQRLGP